MLRVSQAGRGGGSTTWDTCPNMFFLLNEHSLYVTIYSGVRSTVCALRLKLITSPVIITGHKKPVLYSTLLYCTVLYCTVQYFTVLYSTLLYCTVQYCTKLHCTVQYFTVL